MIGRLNAAQLAEFTEFAGVRQRHLMRTAFLLCGDRQGAQDLTQTALLHLCRSWSRASRADSVDAYAHRVLINAYLRQRRKARQESAAQRQAAEAALVAATAAPGGRGDPAGAELRVTLLAALDRLPPKTRAVVVLRFWEDLSVQATAAALGCSEGNVKSQSSRGLARLRELLGDTVFSAGAEQDAGPRGGAAGHPAPPGHPSPAGRPGADGGDGDRGGRRVAAALPDAENGGF